MPITRKRETLLKRLERFFFGDDLFISYSRTDCAIYAADLARRLSKHGFSCRFDQWGTQPGKKIPPELVRAIRRSSTFVLLGTHGAAESQPVREELEVFLATGRMIVPVDFGGAIGKAPWKPMIEGLYISQERQEALTSASASRHLVARIVKTADFTKKDTRLKRTAAALGVAILLATIVAGERMHAAYEAGRLARTAEERADAAIRKAEAAERNASEAGAREAAALRSAADARAQAAEAKRRAVDSNLAAKAAEARRAKAASQAAAALKQAEEAAAARREAELLRGQAVEDALTASGERISGAAGNTPALQESVADALVTYSKFSSSQSPTANGLRIALTDALVKAKQRGMRLGVGDYPRVECFDLSPDGALLLTVGTNGPQDDYTTTLWEPRTGRVLDEIASGGSEMTACALSPDSRLAAIGYKNGDVRVVGTWRHGAGGQQQTLKLPSAIVAVRFTAGGERLIVWAGENWNGDNMYLVDIRSGGYRALPFPRNTLRFFGYRSFFGEHQRTPPFIGAIGTDAQLTLVHTETGVRTSYDLRKHLGKSKDDITFVRAAVVAPNGRWLFVAPEENEAQTEDSVLIDLGCRPGSRKHCRPVRRLERASLDAEASQVAFDPTGKFLVVGGSDAALHVFNITAIEAGGDSTPQEIKMKGQPRLESFSADGEHVATISTASGKQGLHVLEVHSLVTGRLVMTHQLGAEFNWAKPIFRQSDTGEVYVGLHASNIYIWERQPMPGFSLVHGSSTPGVELGGTTDATASPDGKLVATAHSNGKVAMWRREDRALVGVIHGFEGEVFIQWGGASGHYALYAASKTGQLIKWTAGGTLVDLTVPMELKAITELRVSKNGQTIAVRGPSGAIGVLAGQEWQVLDRGEAPDFALSGDGHLLAIGNTRGGGKLVDLRTKQELVLEPYWLKDPVKDLRFAAADSRVVAQAALGNVVIWDVRGGPPLEARRDTVSRPEGVAEGSTAELAAELDGMGGVRILNAADGNGVARVRDSSLRNEGPLHTPSYFGYSATADLAVAGWPPAQEDGEEAAPSAQLLVWQVSSGQPMSRIPLPRRLKRVELIPGARALLVVAIGRPPVIVPLQLQEQFLALCPLILRSIQVDREGLVKFAFCRQTQDLVGDPFTPPRAEAWQLTAAPRTH